MEALVAASVGALTVYDMVKVIERGVIIERVEHWSRDGENAKLHLVLKKIHAGEPGFAFV